MENATALYNEGYYYYTASNGYPLNYKRAYEYFQKAAALGYGDAINYLGIMNLEGKGVEKNVAAAVEWFRKGIQAGNHYSMANLADLFMEGKAVAKNEQLAQKLYQQAYTTGKNPRAAYFVGCDLMNKKQYLEAAKLFNYCAQKTNSPEAWNNLGLLYLDRKVVQKVEPHYYSAFRCFEKAAEEGLVEAMYNCGIVLNRVKKEDEAMTWFYRAAQQGYAPAKKMYKAMSVAKHGIAGLF